MKSVLREERALVQPTIHDGLAGLDQFTTAIKGDPISIFLAYPLNSVRRRCLKEMNESDMGRPTSQSAGYAEGAINDLWRVRDPIREDLLAWYVSRGVELEVVARAIEFAI